MTAWLTFLILSVPSAAPMTPAPRAADETVVPYSETVFATDFEQSADANYDGWPDEWTRRRGKGYPPYVEIILAEDRADEQAAGQFLRIQLDGGGAIAYSPLVPVSPLFAYVFEGRARTSGLTHNVAYFSIAFFDDAQTLLETYTSEKLTLDSPWQTLRIGPLTPQHAAVSQALIGLHLEPTRRSDLTGMALFDDLRLARLPSMSLATDQPYNVFTHPATPRIICSVSGIREVEPTILLELLDERGQTVAREELASTRVSHDTTTAQPAPRAGTSATAPADDQTASVTWSPSVPSCGFYRIQASLSGDARMKLERAMTLAVLSDLQAPGRGTFGWSLPREAQPVSDQVLVDLIRMGCASWLKYPIWYSTQDEPAEGERLAQLADRLAAIGTQMVGVFDRVPPQLLDNHEHLSLADVFLDPQLRQSMIDPLMIRLALKLQWWQLGSDTEDSLTDHPDLAAQMRAAGAHLKQYGQRNQLGLPWSWIHDLPSTTDAPGDFLAVTESPAFTPHELARHLTRAPAESVPLWVTLQPLSRATYDPETRVRDLVGRMLEAKVHGSPAVFLSCPFDDDSGLYHKDGTPTDLLLPWRTTARMIGDAQYLGSLQLPQGSSNFVFVRDDEVTMAVWNTNPLTESLYLGEHVTLIDLWERQKKLPTTDAQSQALQHVPVGPLPVFVTGLNLAVTRWRLSCDLQPSVLENNYERRQTSLCRVMNTFDQGVNGEMVVSVPPSWDIATPRARFKLSPDGEFQHMLELLLRSDASCGTQQVRIDFEIQAERLHRFSVYRPIQVGEGDLLVELDTWLDENGTLMVEQHLRSRTDRSFDLNCYLLAPGRGRVRHQVFGVGAGRVTHSYALPNGTELLGEPIWLRVEELRGGQIRNYRVLATP